MDKELEKDILGLIEDPEHSQEGFILLVEYIKELEKRVAILESKSNYNRPLRSGLRRKL